MSPAAGFARRSSFTSLRRAPHRPDRQQWGRSGIVRNEQQVRRGHGVADAAK